VCGVQQPLKVSERTLSRIYLVVTRAADKNVGVTATAELAADENGFVTLLDEPEANKRK
jgi:hypothetical protein